MKNEKLQFKIKNFWVLLTLTFNFALLPFNFASAQTTYEGSDVPSIHPRSEWLSTPQLQNLFSWYPYESKPAGEVQDYYPVTRIVIHDTGCNLSQAGCNDETVDTPTLIQNIFRFHAVTRGWGDIGYHYIVDRKGEIWEGRYGGNGVRGAHVYNDHTCQNFNVGTIGITVIGNYFSTPMPPMAMESLKRLVAWLAFANNIDVQNQTLATPVWTNQKNASGTCDVSESSGGFTTTFTGRSVLTHRQLEPTNSDIATMDFTSLDSGVLTYLNEMKTYAFKEQGTENLYDLAQAKVQALTTTGKKIITLLKTQLDWFRPELFAKKPEPLLAQTPAFPDGTLLKAKGKEEVYLIKDQKRIHISSASLFEGLALAWSNIKEAEEVSVTALPMADPIVFPDGILMQAGTPDIYYIKDRKRYLISSADLFSAYHFKKEDLVQLTLPELDRYYPWGGYVKWPEGSILRNVFNTDQVVLVQNDALQSISAKAIPKNKQVYSVSGREIASYQMAQVLTPSVILALSQAFDAVKQKLGLSSLAAAATASSNPQIATGSDTPQSPATTPAPEKQIPASPTPPAASTPQDGKPASVAQPTIRVALCKNRSIENCSFNTSDVPGMHDNGEGGVIVEGYEDHPGFSPQANDNAFRGNVTLVPAKEAGKVWLVNELPLEDYLKGIAETLGNDKPEYRKVLITMARTYAYYYLTQDKKYPDKPFDVSNTPFDQLYRGYNYEKRSNGLPAVVEATTGQIITYQGKPIVAAYSSDSNGITKNACPAWTKYCTSDGKLKPDFAYLQGGVSDPEGTIHDAAKVKASHGVGVSAAGARRLIDLAKTYQEVLRYYYAGIGFEKIY